MKNKKNFKLKFILSLFVLFILSFLIFLFSPLPENAQKPNWFFYDKNGEVLFQEKNLNLSTKSSPDSNGKISLESGLDFENLFFTKALISLEDEHFYNHSGINFSALLRATKQNIFEKRVISGASTITMQLAKILYLPNQKHNFVYKIKQIFYALKLEVKLSKEEILRKYLQNIAFGNNTKGIDEASQKYFSKQPQNLSIGESLILLSIIQNPSLFNPIAHPENTEKRKKLILKRLTQSQILTEEQSNFWSHQKSPLNISISNQIIAPHFIFWVQKELQENPNFKRILNSKNKHSEIHVYTTLDKQKYEKSLNITQKILENLEEKNIHNASIMALNENQELEIMLGSPDFFNKNIDGAVNLTTAFRQTGSVLKPFLYALALDKKFSPLSILKDEKQIFQSGYFPRNFNIKEFNGKVYFREALANSYNIAAVYLLNQVGPQTFFNFTQTLGLNFQQNINELGESFILGAGSTSLLNLTKAYSIFNNEGQLKPIKFFTIIKDENQKEILSWEDFCKMQQHCKSKNILSKNSAEWVTHALSDQKIRWKNFEKGNPLELSFPSGAKTGTSQNFVDNWVIGFSPQYTVGVWMGNANGTPLHSSSGIEGTGPLWHKIMQFLHKNKPSQEFKYSGNRQEKIICRKPKDAQKENCSEKFTAFLLDSEFDNFKNQKHKNATPLQSGNLKDSLKVIYPKSGDIFLENTDILIQTNFQNHDSENLEFFLDNQKLNSPIIKNLKSGNYKIKVRNKNSQNFDEISIRVK